MKYSTVLIDLDDTLIANAYSYYIPQLDAAKLICIDLLWDAPNPIEIINRATQIQVKDIQEQGRISKECFPISYVKVYEEICAAVGRAPNPNMVSGIATVCQNFFLKEYSLFPFVKETLTRIKQPKILLTRGDEDIQGYKIENVKLGPYFDHIEIVDLKTTQTYRDVMKKYNLDPEKCVMVGDSIKNDIVPALEVGMHGFHLVSHREDWEMSHRETKDTSFLKNPKYKELKSFQELLKYLD
jgi:putative hydrolase of the HAD superfamily